MYHVKLNMDKDTYDYIKCFAQYINVVFIIILFRLVKSSIWLYL